MSSTEVVEVQVREGLGSRHARRLRTAGQTPVVLYGHGEETVSLTISSDQVDSVLRHGARVVELKGAATGSAFIREVQWDAFGNDVLHMDLTRVQAGETVEMEVPVELRGVAPGTRSGGVVQHLLHELHLKCSVGSIPEKLTVNINSLELLEAITVADVELPSGAETTAEPDAVIVQCVEATEEVEESAVADGAEPEVIGRKEEDEEGGES